METHPNRQRQIASWAMTRDQMMAQASRIALLKIQSLQFATVHPEVGVHYQHEAKEMVYDALLYFVPNGYVLNESGYYLGNAAN